MDHLTSQFSLTRNDEEPVAMHAESALIDDTLMQNAQTVSIPIAIEVRNLPRSNFKEKYDRANIRKNRFRVGILR